MTKRSCVGDMSKRGVVMLIAWVSGMLYNQGGFDIGEKISDDSYQSALNLQFKRL